MRRSGVRTASRDVLIDAGANIGTTCIPFVRETGCRALAIEPVTENFLHLKKNVESSSLSHRVILVQNAVSNKSRRLRMRLTGEAGGHFVERETNAALFDNPAACEDVAADTLTAIVAAAGLSTNEIAIVWADVQGSELDVIESGKPLWECGVPLWTEIEPRSLIRQGNLTALPAAAAACFNRFIDSRDLMRSGERATPMPIGKLASFIARIEPDNNTDILLLPSGF